MLVLQLGKLSNMRTLNLQGTFGCGCVKKHVKFIAARTGCRMGDGGAKALGAQLGKLPNMCTLDVCGTYWRLMIVPL